MHVYCMFRMMALIVCNEGGGGALPARVGLSSECHFHFGVSPSLQAWDPNSILLAIEKVSQTSQTKTCLRSLHVLIWYYVTFGVHCTLCSSEHCLSLLMLTSYHQVLRRFGWCYSGWRRCQLRSFDDSVADCLSTKLCQLDHFLQTAWTKFKIWLQLDDSFTVYEKVATAFS